MARAPWSRPSTRWPRLSSAMTSRPVPHPTTRMRSAGLRKRSYRALSQGISPPRIASSLRPNSSQASVIARLKSRSRRVPAARWIAVRPARSSARAALERRTNDTVRQLIMALDLLRRIGPSIHDEPDRFTGSYGGRPIEPARPVRRCLVCGDGRANLVLTQTATTVLRCAHCGLVFVDPLPGDRELRALYLD